MYHLFCLTLDCCAFLGYAKALGSTNQNTKVAQAHLQLMQKHLQAFEFLGLEPLPPKAILRKFEQPPKEENPDFTTSSESESEQEELEDFLEHQDEPKTYEEQLIAKQHAEERKVLQGKSLANFVP